MPDPTREEMIDWLNGWCERLGCELNLHDSVGDERNRVPVISITAYGGDYVLYRWADDEASTHEPNGLMWVPEGVYLQHDYVAIRDTGPEALARMYEWGQWFDRRGFFISTSRYEGVARINRPQTEPPEGQAARFERMRWLLETKGEDGVIEAIAMLIDEAEAAADGRGRTWRAGVDAKLRHLSGAIDVMEVGP